MGKRSNVAVDRAHGPAPSPLLRLVPTVINPTPSPLQYMVLGSFDGPLPSEPGYEDFQKQLRERHRKKDFTDSPSARRQEVTDAEAVIKDMEFLLANDPRTNGKVLSVKRSIQNPTHICVTGAEQKDLDAAKEVLAQIKNIAPLIFPGTCAYADIPATPLPAKKGPRPPRRER